MLIAGLMNWIGSAPPRSESLAGLKTIAQAQIHLKSILEAGGQILGNRPLELDALEPDEFLSESPGTNCLLMKGYDVIRPATSLEQGALPVLPTWGYLIIRHRAEALARNAA